ncbi:hypothetical protein ACKFKG_26690 [Phormidesmis sp. 146-35]
MSMTVNPLNDIYKQAHQGSVAAIIQVLNDKLSDSGVRTRAIFANGVLQLLCEAPTEEQLEQTMLTDRVRKILESIAPRNIRRVNINSRIVREQQLLWLEEINRDPDGQLLWSKEISLARQSLFKRFREDLKERSANSYDLSNLPKSISPQIVREQRQFTRGIVGGLALSLGLLGIGWGVYAWQNGRSVAESQPAAPANPIAPVPNAESQPIASPSPVAPVPKVDQPTVTSNSVAPVTKNVAPVPAKTAPTTPTPAQDPFAAAVRLAEKAAKTGQTAKTPAQWLELSNTWGKASDLMSAVPTSDKRYVIAQDRRMLYRRYQESALQRTR